MQWTAAAGRGVRRRKADAKRFQPSGKIDQKRAVADGDRAGAVDRAINAEVAAVFAQDGAQHIGFSGDRLCDERQAAAFRFFRAAAGSPYSIAAAAEPFLFRQSRHRLGVEHEIRPERRLLISAVPRRAESQCIALVVTMWSGLGL